MFVALDLPEPAKSDIASWRDELVAGRSDLRPVAAEALHVTLVFLAWQNERDAGAIATAAFEAAAPVGAPRVTPAGLRPLPPRAPRLFALDLDDEAARWPSRPASQTLSPPAVGTSRRSGPFGRT